jgi:DNA-directed RNA polymerase subunit beta
VTDEIVYLDAAEEAQYTIAQASAQVDDKTGRFVDEQVLCRSREGEAVTARPKDVDFMDVAPAQIVSVATALIPFLEHNDANRALMGANMQRQAVPLMITQSPLVGTGLEYRAAVDTGDVIVAEDAGTVTDVDAERIVVDAKEGKHEYPLTKFMRSNQGTLIHQKPIVRLGDRVQGRAGAGRRQLDRHGRARARREPARRLHAVGGLQLRGRDRDLGAARQGGRALLDPHPRVRDRRALDEARRRGDHARHPEPLGGVAQGPRRARVVRIGAEVGSGDLLVGKVTPKGETELTAEEKLIRAIFKEKAREVRDTSLKVPHGEGGKVIDVKTFSRDAGDDLSPGVNELVRVYVAKKRKIAGGRQARRPPRQQGRDREDRARRGHAVPGGRAARGRRAQPARRAEPDEHRPDPRDAPRLGGGARRLPRERRLGQRRREPDRDPGLRRRDRGWTSTRRSSSGRSRTRTRRSRSWSTRSGPRAGTASGKVRMFDGRTGESFSQKVTVGYMYILKLLHLVDDKIHARSTGPTRS